MRQGDGIGQMRIANSLSLCAPDKKRKGRISRMCKNHVSYSGEHQDRLQGSRKVEQIFRARKEAGFFRYDKKLPISNIRVSSVTCLGYDV
jgi:hypothetical protein